jgi:hypothetical protein
MGSVFVKSEFGARIAQEGSDARLLYASHRASHGGDAEHNRCDEQQCGAHLRIA